MDKERIELCWKIWKATPKIKQLYTDIRAGNLAEKDLQAALYELIIESYTAGLWNRI